MNPTVADAVGRRSCQLGCGGTGTKRNTQMHSKKTVKDVVFSKIALLKVG